MTSLRTSEPNEETPSDAAQRGGRYVPRFGLRSLFVVALLFCLLFAWMGRNFVRMRREDAAIEALKQAGGMVLMKEGDGQLRHPAFPAPRAYPIAGSDAAPEQPWYARLLGWADRPAIQRVNLDSYGVEPAKIEAALAALSVFPEIESVSLRDDGFDDSSIPPLLKLRGLKAISLDGTRVTGEGLAMLGPPLEVRRLSVHVKYSDGLLSGLASLNELRSLTIQETGLRRSDLEAIAALPYLEELKLRHCGAYGDDNPFQPLENAKRLRVLEVLDNPFIPYDLSFRDDDVPAIAELPALETLTIWGISNAGVARLGALPKLRTANLKSPVGVAGAQAFSAAHPECLVRYEDAAFGESAYLAGVAVDPEMAITGAGLR